MRQSGFSVLCAYTMIRAHARKNGVFGSSCGSSALRLEGWREREASPAPPAAVRIVPAAGRWGQAHAERDGVVTVP